MKTNHKWNILNIMRFYGHMNKKFNAEIYMEFIAPFDKRRKDYQSPIDLATTRQIIRRHVAKGRCVRVGDRLRITEKGLVALRLWEKARYVEEADVSAETLRRRRVPRQ